MAKLCKLLPREVHTTPLEPSRRPSPYFLARAGQGDSVPALGFECIIPIIPEIPRSWELVLAISKSAMIPSCVLFGRVAHARASSAKRSSGKFWTPSWTPSLFMKCSSYFVSSAFDSRVVLLPKSRVAGSIPAGRTSIFLDKTPLTSDLSTPCRIVRLSISDSWRFSKCPKGSNFW